MLSRYDHFDPAPIDLDVMRALSARDERWMTLERVTRDAGWDPNCLADTTRTLASLAYLRRAGLVVWWRPSSMDRPSFALTERGAAELAGRDQLRLTA